MRMTIAAAALAMLAAPTLADAQNVDYANMIRTRDITGSDIYTTNEAYDEGAWAGVTYDALGTDWNEIGEVEDVILDRSGAVAGIVAEIGGFLDIADKHVFLPMSDLRLVADGDDYVVVTRWNEEQLEELEGVDEGWWQ